MTEPLQMSNSEIQCFKRCRRKWWLTYYRCLKPIRERMYGPRAIGTRLHACVAYYYNLQASDEVDYEEATEQALELHDWAVELDVDRVPEQEENIRKDADLSRAMLEGYFEWLEEEGHDEAMTVVAAEEELEKVIETPVTRTPVRIRTKLDLRVQYEGAGGEEDMFLDHKTVQNFADPIKVLHLDEQMLMYDWMARWHDIFVSGATYNMLRKVKRTARANPPFFDRFTVRHSKQELRSFHTRLMGELEEIIRVRKMLDKGEDPLFAAYPTPNRNCSWDCDFFDVCIFLDRPDDDPDDYLARIYEVGDPYERYDQTQGVVE